MNLQPFIKSSTHKNTHTRSKSCSLTRNAYAANISRRINIFVTSVSCSQTTIWRFYSFTWRCCIYHAFVLLWCSCVAFEMRSGSDSLLFQLSNLFVVYLLSFKSSLFNIDIHCCAWCDSLNMLPHSFHNVANRIACTVLRFAASQLLISCYEDGCLHAYTRYILWVLPRALRLLNVAQMHHKNN